MTRRTGTRKAHLVQRHTNRRMAPYGRDLSRRTRILHVDRMADGRALRETKVHLRGNAPLLFYSSSFCSRRAHEPTLLSRSTSPPVSLQLFENQSVVEYWENFASHAFENTTKAVYSHCVLLKPSGAPLPATFCFSIRRDIFDLPSIVIGELSRFWFLGGANEVSLKGQWLPLL